MREAKEFSFVLIEAVQRTLRLRQEALGELLRSPREKQQSEWGRQRLYEIDVHDAWLSAIAKRYDCKPQDLIDAAKATKHATELVP